MIGFQENIFLKFLCRLRRGAAPKKHPNQILAKNQFSHKQTKQTKNNKTMKLVKNEKTGAMELVLGVTLLSMPSETTLQTKVNKKNYKMCTISYRTPKGDLKQCGAQVFEGKSNFGEGKLVIGSVFQAVGNRVEGDASKGQAPAIFFRVAPILWGSGPALASDFDDLFAEVEVDEPTILAGK